MYWSSIPFKWFHDMCAYGLIHCTSGVVTHFLPFPRYFSFWSLKDIKTTLNRTKNSQLSKFGRSSLFEGQYKAYESFLVLRLLCSFLFIWIPNIVLPICVFISLMYGIGRNGYNLVRWLWDETSILRLVISYISMCNKSRTLSNVHIRRVYVYSI